MISMTNSADLRINVRGFEGGEAEAKDGEKKEAESVQKMHSGRVIVRNIGFDMTEKHLRKCFDKFGKITEVNVPLKDNSKLNRGFAFVEFDTKEQALAAITGMHSQKWKGRTVAVEMSQAKGLYSSKIDSIVEHTNMSRQAAVLPKVLRMEKKEQQEKKEEQQAAREKEKE